MKGVIFRYCAVVFKELDQHVTWSGVISKTSQLTTITLTQDNTVPQILDLSLFSFGQ